MEDLAAMKAGGCQGVFCNVGDFAPDLWQTVRERAAANGMFCGPWARTAKGPTFDPLKLALIVEVAQDWDSPCVVNSEKELDGSGATLTREIAQAIAGLDAAVSVEPIPFASVDWTPLANVPILPQIFPPDQSQQYDPVEIRDLWWSRGVSCVYVTYATYGGMKPSDYDLKAAYSLYTGDDIPHPTYAAWKPTSSGWEACKPVPPKPPLTPKQVPYTGPYSLASGPHRSRGPTAKALKIAMKRMGEAPFAGKPNDSFDLHYNAALEAALDRTTNPNWNGYGEKRWEAVRGLMTERNEYALNKEARDLILTDYAQMTQPKLPDLGPLWAGGRSVLDHQLTHDTDGLRDAQGRDISKLYPAFDDAWKPGTVIIAPEDIEVTRDSSSNPGDAFYAEGESLDYWIAHLVSAPAKGTKLKKGQRVGVVLDHSIGGGPHAHCAVNVERLLGAGVALEWGRDGNGPDYTFGSPTIREQLERLLV